MIPRQIAAEETVATSPDAMAQAMIDNLKEKTGKALPQWLAILNKSKLAKHGEIVKFLKGEHAVTHGFASMIAHQKLKSAAFTSGESSGELIAKQYSGPKADLKPIYDAIVVAVKKFGADVEVSPKKAYVSLRRKKQFAIIQPSSKDRVDVGINLKGKSPTDRLEKSGSFNSMVSHRVRLGSKKDVNAELKKWLKAAYEAA